MTTASIPSTPSTKWKLAKRKNIRINIKVLIMELLITAANQNTSCPLRLVLRKKRPKRRSQIMPQTHSKSSNCPTREALLMLRASLSALRRNRPRRTILSRKLQHLRIASPLIIPLKIAQDENWTNQNPNRWFLINLWIRRFVGKVEINTKLTVTIRNERAILRKRRSSPNLKK